MHGITNDKILDQFIHELKPIIGHEALEENPQTFEKACVLAERISQISNLVSGGGKCIKWCETPDYAPIGLDSMGTC